MNISDLKERISQLQNKNQESGGSAHPEVVDSNSLIPLDVQKFFDKYRESTKLLIEMVKQMERSLEKWSTQQQVPNEVPTLEPLTLTYPYKFAEALERVNYVATKTPGVLNKVVEATEAALIDMAALERQNLVKLYQSIIEKIFKAYLVNEVPVIDRSIHETKTVVNVLIKLLEKAETNPTERQLEILTKYIDRFELCLMQMRQHITDFPEQQKKFADAMKQFAQGLHCHYERGRSSINATLELLEEQTGSHGRGQKEK